MSSSGIPFSVSDERSFFVTAMKMSPSYTVRTELIVVAEAFVFAFSSRQFDHFIRTSFAEITPRFHALDTVACSCSRAHRRILHGDSNLAVAKNDDGVSSREK